MTEKELNRLSKGELLELMFSLRKEYDSLVKENERLKELLINKEDIVERLERIERVVSNGQCENDNIQTEAEVAEGER